MAVRIISATHNGLEGFLINVEVDICKGLPQLVIVGLPDASVKEARERVRAAIVNSGFEFPLGRITINLAPADVRKIGSLFDLPIALGILMESKQIPYNDLSSYITFGELSLFGELKGVKGTVPIILQGIKHNIKKYIFPYENLNEAEYFNKEEFYPFKTLKEVISFVKYGDILPIKLQKNVLNDKKHEYLDYGAIIGQYTSKRALEIAAAGNHNIILYGEPGCGKTMLARALISILPKLSEKEKLEVANIYSIIGILKQSSDKNYRPFRAPHHTSTKVALIGGGKEIKPGEITLAHNGVLFLDEILEFKKEVLEALREPLEEKKITINRNSGSFEMPADFLLVGAFNPVEQSYGKLLEDSRFYDNELIRRYSNKFSSALLDRIDILNYVPRINYDEIESKKDIYDSKLMREKVLVARKAQEERFKGTEYKYNSDLKGKDIIEICRMNKKCSKILKEYYNKYNISLRGYGKAIKIARTIADIEGKKDMSECHLFEAFSYRKNINGESI